MRGIETFPMLLWVRSKSLSPPGKLGTGGKQSCPALEQRQLGLTEAPTTGFRAHKATGGEGGGGGCLQSEQMMSPADAPPFSCRESVSTETFGVADLNFQNKLELDTVCVCRDFSGPC